MLKEIIRTQHFLLVSQIWEYLFHMTGFQPSQEKSSQVNLPTETLVASAGARPLALLTYWVAFSCSHTLISIISGDRSHSARSKNGISWQLAAPSAGSALFLLASVIVVFLLHLAHPWQYCEGSKPSPFGLEQLYGWAEDRKHGPFLYLLPKQRRENERSFY